MNSISLTWDTTSLSRLFDNHGAERALFRSLKAAGGDAIRAVSTDSVRNVRARKSVKAGRVRKALPLDYPRAAEIDGLVWRMRVSGAPARVSDFPFRQARKGVSATINAGKRVLIKGAFEATLKSGHVGVFKRSDKNRLPIKELFTSRISDVFNDSGVVPGILDRARTVFEATMTRVVPLELAKI